MFKISETHATLGQAILARLKWWIAKEEMQELERWRLKHQEYRRWLSEFPAVSSTLDNMLIEVQGKESLDICHPPSKEGPWDVSGLRYNLRFNLHARPN